MPHMYYICDVLVVLHMFYMYNIGVHPTHVLYMCGIYTCIKHIKHVYYRCYAHVLQVYMVYMCNTPKHHFLIISISIIETFGFSPIESLHDPLCNPLVSDISLD